MQFSARLHCKVAEWSKTRKSMELEGEKWLSCSRENHLFALCSELWILPSCFTWSLHKVSLIAQWREEDAKLALDSTRLIKVKISQPFSNHGKIQVLYYNILKNVVFVTF